jgi:sugar phosphate isomerase/epimerase
MTIALSTSIRCGGTLTEALDAARTAGIADVDLLTIEGWRHVNPSALATDWDATLATFEPLLAERRLRLVALNSGVGPAWHDRSADAVAKRARDTDALLRVMKRHGIVVSVTQPPLKWQEAWTETEQDACILTLREIQQQAAAQGLELVLELHERSPFESVDQVERLLRVYPEVRTVFDPTHFLKQGIRLQDTERYLPYARHMHVRDAAPGHIQVAWGTGQLDLDWLAAAARRAGFRGNVSIEYLGGGKEEFDTLASARAIHAELRKRFA